MYGDKRQEHEKEEFTIYDFYGIMMLSIGLVWIFSVFILEYIPVHLHIPYITIVLSLLSALLYSWQEEQHQRRKRYDE